MKDKEIDSIILGSYTCLNSFTLALLKHLHIINKPFYCWAEANYLTIGQRNDNLFKSVIRRIVYSSVDQAALIPGKMAVITFEKWNIVMNKFIFFPNTIDESKFVYLGEGYRNTDKYPIFIMPVRLIENLKGVINFFEAIGDENIKKAIFLVAGDGIDKQRYLDYIAKNNYQDNIKMLGFCNTEEMIKLYHTANALLLPSLSDPSPLSLVEALRFHLPILCSNHCGNHFEAVSEGINGYTFDPLDMKNIKKIFELFMRRRNEWVVMANKGVQNYKNTYKLDKVVSNFLREY